MRGQTPTRTLQPPGFGPCFRLSFGPYRFAKCKFNGGSGPYFTLGFGSFRLTTCKFNGGSWFNGSFIERLK